ncbi:uncharacterized protein LOC142982119 [Anticarsia gemmatalis]|uniref:uncharacterized protein LOC142982119 n=1 Tax=Anticarsia gemmatalis TaxID=129554 RepID=UPI003F7634BE
MKVVIALCVLTFVSFASATPQAYPRGCIYVLGKCYKECEVGTHAYATGCGQKTPEATCEQPNPVKEEGIICDYSACYCDPPTVRDSISGKCVPIEQCPKK